MGANAFYRQSPLLNYQPVPFRDIAFAGEKLRKASDDSLDRASKIAGAEADVLKQDEALRNQILDDYDARSQSIYDLSKSDPMRAKDKAKQIGLDLQRDLTRGALASQVANKKAAMKNFEDIDAQLKAGTISKDDAVKAKQFAMNRYSGVGTPDEFGSYASYDPYTVASLKDSFAKQADDFITGWKSDKYPLGLTKTNNGYINNSTKEFVDPEEVQQAAMQFLQSDPKNMAYAKQQADFSTMGVDAARIPEGYRDQYIQNQFLQAAMPVSDKAGFTKIDRKLSKDWQQAMYMQDAIDNPVLPDYHVRLGAGEPTGSTIPEDIKEVAFDEYGNPKKSSSLLAPPAYDVNLTEEQNKMAKANYDQRVKEDKLEKGRAIYERAQSFNIPIQVKNKDGKVIRNKTPKEVAEEMKRAYKHDESRETTARVIRDPKVSKDLGNVLANTMGSSTFYITQKGTGQVMNPDGDFNTVAKELANDWGWTGSNSPEEARLKIEEQLRTNGQSGWYDGKPYLEVTGDDGQKRMIVMSGNKEVDRHTALPNTLLKARSKHEPASFYDDRTGSIYLYSPSIENGKFKDEVHVIHKAEGVPIPDINPLHMTPQERSMYYNEEGESTVAFDDVLRMTENILKRGNQQVVTKKTSTPRLSE